MAGWAPAPPQIRAVVQSKVTAISSHCEPQHIMVCIGNLMPMIFSFCQRKCSLNNTGLLWSPCNAPGLLCVKDQMRWGSHPSFPYRLETLPVMTTLTAALCYWWKEEVFLDTTRVTPWRQCLCNLLMGLCAAESPIKAQSSGVKNKTITWCSIMIYPLLPQH